MKASLRSVMWKYMLLVVAVTAVIRIGLWFGYETYLFHEQKGMHPTELTRVYVLEEFNELLLLVIVEVAALMVLVFMLWKFSRRILSPIRSIANGAQMISRGALKKRIRTEHLPSGELYEIANSLNTAFDQYQQAVDRIAQFTAAASHQLRTPLTAMQTTAELCLQEDRSGQEYVETISSLLEETQRLSHMTEQLLALSRIESEHHHTGFDTVDLREVVRQALDYYEPILDSRGIKLETNMEAQANVWAQPPLLLEVVINLLDNAIKVCDTGDYITISTAPSPPHHICLTVADSGPGIPAAYQEHIFERFSRCPTTPYSGSGLGLAIVSEIVKLHKGSIRVENNPRGGAIFRIMLMDETFSNNESQVPLPCNLTKL